MLNNISVLDFSQALAEEHPYWDPAAINATAQNYINTWDEQLQDVVEKYISTREILNFKYGEFSILKIKALRCNCGFFEAINLMNEYIRNPKVGRLRILRH